MSLVVVAVAGGSACAQEPHMQWWEYLKGEWTYEVEDEKGTATWRIAAKGNALVGRFKGENGSTGVELCGWQSDTKTEVVNGYGSRGNYWSMLLTKHTAQVFEGENAGTSPDGTKYKGKISGRKVDENTYTWEFTGETSTGEPMTMSATFKRKTN